MKGNTEPKIHPQKGTEFLSKFTHKSWILVKDDHLGHSMLPKNVAHKQPVILGCSYFLSTWYHVGHLGEAVYKSYSSSLALQLR